MDADTKTPQTQTKRPPPAPPVKPTVAKDDPWRPMDSAPRDGSYIFLRGDPCMDKGADVENHWFWYRTRQFRKGTFQPVGWWRRRFGPPALPSFTPSGWRPIHEGIPAE